jgi:Tfp pilus assembly protein PilF
MKPGVLSIVFLGLMAGAQAAPHLPAHGAQVVEVLPWRGDARQRELRALREQLAAAPRDLALATSLARRQIELGRRHADPRYFGYAQAALAPWWSEANPPAEVRVLRASLLQTSHRFAPALADLDAVLRVDGADAQAWLTRANILTVQARYDEARAACAQLARLATPMVAATCAAADNPANGARSTVLLEALYQRERGADAATDSWVATVLAELAVRRGAAQDAERHYRSALAATPDDSYVLGSYADFLLDAGRAAQVVALLEPHQRIDGLLLRYALASRATGLTQQAARAQNELKARFDAAALRKDGTHLREHSRYALRLANDPALALRLARDNWQDQKEPADARVLLEAALAANDATAATPVLAWMRASGIDDVQLAALAAKLKGKT